MSQTIQFRVRVCDGDREVLATWVTDDAIGDYLAAQLREGLSVHVTERRAITL